MKSNARVCVASSFEGKEGQAVLIINRRHFPLDHLQQLVRDSSMTLQFNNDIYSKASRIRTIPLLGA